MLGKLLKYELKAYSRALIPIYIAILVISLFLGISFRNVNILNGLLENTTIVMMFVLFGLMVALVVLNIVTCIQRFKKNLLENEGYLMLTLPVRVSNLVLSKFLIALLFSILSLILSVLSFTIIMYLGSGISLSDFTTTIINDFDIKQMIEANVFIKDFIYVLITLGLGILFTYSTFILTIYTSLSVGQLPMFNNHRTIVAFISFFVINWASSIIENFILRLTNADYYNLINSFIDYSFTDPVITRMTITSSIFSLIIMGVLFTSTSFILDKKLNLE